MVSELPLFLFTMLCGASAGLYVAYALFGNARSERRWLLPLASLILLAIGGLCVLGHLAHPERAINALANPNAGITREAYGCMAFGLFVLADLVLSRMGRSTPKVVIYLGAACGVLLTIIMGFAYSSIIGVGAWDHWATVPFFLLGSVVIGFPVYMLLNKTVQENRAYLATLAICTVLLLVDTAIIAVHFSEIGLSPAPFIVSVVIIAATMITAIAISKAKSTLKQSAFVALAVCTLVGVGIARYAFYAAYLG